MAGRDPAGGDGDAAGQDHAEEPDRKVVRELGPGGDGTRHHGQGGDDPRRPWCEQGDGQRGEEGAGTGGDAANEHGRTEHGLIPTHRGEGRPAPADEHGEGGEEGGGRARSRPRHEGEEQPEDGEVPGGGDGQDRGRQGGGQTERADLRGGLVAVNRKVRARWFHLQLGHTSTT